MTAQVNARCSHPRYVYSQAHRRASRGFSTVRLVIISGALVFSFALGLSLYHRVSPQESAQQVEASKSDQHSNRVVHDQVDSTSASPRDDQRLEVKVDEVTARDMKRRRLALQSWRDLKDVPLESLIETREAQQDDGGQQAGSSVGILGGGLKQWRDVGAREGFEVSRGADRPTLRSGPVSVRLRVRDGWVLGAEVSFSEGLKGDQGGGANQLAAGPEWARVATLLAGSSVLGGEDDPMMMFDPAPPKENPMGLEITPRATPRTKSGVWVREGKRGVAYHLELSESGVPERGLLWLSTARD